MPDLTGSDLPVLLHKDGCLLSFLKAYVHAHTLETSLNFLVTKFVNICFVIFVPGSKTNKRLSYKECCLVDSLLSKRTAKVLNLLHLSRLVKKKKFKLWPDVLSTSQYIMDASTAITLLFASCIALCSFSYAELTCSVRWLNMLSPITRKIWESFFFYN